MHYYCCYNEEGGAPPMEQISKEKVNNIIMTVVKCTVCQKTIEIIEDV